MRETVRNGCRPEQRRQRTFGFRLFLLLLGLGLGVHLGLPAGDGLAQPAGSRQDSRSGGNSYVQAKLFTVHDVAVDRRANTAAAARKLALREGRKQGLHRLLERLVDRAHLEAAKAVFADTDLSTLVRAMEIGQEKSSSVRYLARLTLRFRPKIIREMLKAKNIPFIEFASKPILVLPVYDFEGAYLLWEKSNPWLKAWRKRVETSDTLVPFIVPPGGLQDAQLIGTQQALDGEPHSLRAIARRHQAHHVLVAVAQAAYSPDRRKRILTVRATRYGLSEKTRLEDQVLTTGIGKRTGPLFRKAVDQLAVALESSWKNANVITSTQPATLIRVHIGFSRFKEWLEIRERIDSLPVLERHRVLLLTRTRAEMELWHKGTLDQLRRAIALADLILEQQAGRWFLSLLPSDTPYQ